VDYASYSYGDDCFNSETGPINQTCESADVDVAQDKKSLSDRTPDNSTSVHELPPAEMEHDFELTEDEVQEEDSVEGSLTLTAILKRCLPVRVKLSLIRLSSLQTALSS
jgi:conjugal transfer pilus assembly protein TraI